MPNDLNYSIKIDISQAQAAAAQLRALFQQQLQSMTFPLIDPNSISAAVSSTQALTAQYQQMAEFALQTQTALQAAAQAQLSAPPTPPAPPDELGALARIGIGIAALKEVKDAIEEIGTKVIEFSKLNVEVKRANEGFLLLSGSAANADAKLKAMVSASGGALSNLQAMQLANVAASRGIANTADSMEQMTRVASIASRVMGTDIVSAFNAMENAAARQSTRGIAQLGLPIDAVKQKYQELLSSGQDLSKEQAFLMAELAVGDSTFAKLGDSALTAASGAEKLATSWANLVEVVASSRLGDAANTAVSGLADDIKYISGLMSPFEVELYNLDAAMTKLDRKRVLAGPLAVGADLSGAETALASLRKILIETDAAIAKGVPGAQKYHDQLIELAAAVEADGKASMFLKPALADVEAGLKRATSAAKEHAQAQQAIVAATQAATNSQNTGAEFQQVSNSLRELNQGSLDAVPGVSKLRDELTKMYEIIASGTPLTDAQTATLAGLSAQADALGGSTSALAGIQANLGGEFLRSHGYAADLVEQIANLELLYATGQTGANQFAGGMSTLTGALYATLLQAGALTPKLRELLGLLAALGSGGSGAGLLQGPTLGGAPLAGGGFLPAGGWGAAPAAERQSGVNQADAAIAIARSKQDAVDRAEVLKEQLAANKKAASGAGQAFNQAATETEKAFQKVTDNLTKSLEKVDGLLSNSKVTAEDMAAAQNGTYVDKADELRRQLDDFAQNGVSHGIDLQKIKDALGKVGVKASDDLKTLAQQFDEAWGNSSLFANKDNLKLINADAVKAAIDLKANADLGRKNILEYFGATIDAVKAKFKAGDPEIVGAVGAELGASNDKNIQAMGDQLKAGGQKIIDKVLAMAQASIDKTVGSLGTGGGGGGGGGITIPTVNVGTPTGAGGFLSGTPFAPGGAGGVVPVTAQVTGFAPTTATLPPIPVQAMITGYAASFAPLPPLPVTAQLSVAQATVTALLTGLTPPVMTITTVHVASTAGQSILTDIANALATKVADFRSQGVTIRQVIEAGFAGSDKGRGQGSPLGDAIFHSVGDGLQAHAAGFTAQGATARKSIVDGFLGDGKGTPLGDAIFHSVGDGLQAHFAGFTAQGKTARQEVDAGFTGNDKDRGQGSALGDVIFNSSSAGLLAHAAGFTAQGKTARVAIEAGFLGDGKTNVLGDAIFHMVGDGLQAHSAGFVADGKAILDLIKTGTSTIGKGQDGALTSSLTTIAQNYVEDLGTQFTASTPAITAIGTSINTIIGRGLNTPSKAASSGATAASPADGFIAALKKRFDDADFSSVEASLNAKINGIFADKKTEVSPGISTTTSAFNFSGVVTGFTKGLSSAFKTQTPVFSGIGDSAGTFIGFGITDHDFSGAGSLVISHVATSFSTDQARNQLIVAGATLSGPIFSGFKSSLSYSPWVSAIVAEVVAQAAASLNTSLQDSLKPQALGF